ncbi:hypothetical protein L2E82_40409 [Cichorium intybus]|uniref:Uncharacterized protein n=1 Tax=Cichorium intybus TaxID=13427 RepID=A0ACB9AMA2_CICIN|nr:hypothetical protein L2E82_40409 [Cichorium intybus]
MTKRSCPIEEETTNRYRLGSDEETRRRIDTGPAEAIDQFAIIKTKATETGIATDVDPRLEAIFERMLNKEYSEILYPLLEVYQDMEVIFVNLKMEGITASCTQQEWYTAGIERELRTEVL